MLKSSIYTSRSDALDMYIALRYKFVITAQIEMIKLFFVMQKQCLFIR